MQTRRARRLRHSLLIALPVLALAIIIFILAPRERETVPQSSPDTRQMVEPPPAGTSALVSASNASEQTERPAPSLGYKAGQKLTYQIHQFRDLTMRMKQPAAQPGAAPEMSDIRLNVAQRGQLSVQVLADILRDDQPAGWWMEFRWLEPMIEAEIGQIADPDQRRQMRETRHILEGEIARGTLLAEVLPNGEIRRMRARSLKPGEALNHWLDLLSRWQIALAGNAETMEWDISEEDSTGTYLAHYRRVAGITPLRLVKRKIRYTEVHANATSPDNTQAPRVNVRGETTIDIDAYPTSITGDETLRMARSGMFFVNGHSSFKLQLVSAEMDSAPPAPVLAEEMLKRLAADGEEITWINTVDPRAANRTPPPSSPQDIEALVDALKRLHNRGGAESDEELMLAKDLINGVRAGGKPVVSQILDCLTDDREDSGFAAVLTGVLGAADTKEAHRGLLAIMADPEWPVQIRKLALESSVQVTHPAEEADPVLQQLCREEGPLSETALLMLGVTGDQVRDESPERFNEISDFIEEQTEEYSSDSTGEDLGALLLTLAAIGNLGPPEIPPVVTQSLAHAEADIRANAVLSLARIESDQALQLILEALRNDPDEDVQVIALRLAGDAKRPGALDLLCETVQTSASDRLRAEALAGLDAWGSDETVIGIVQTVSARDASPQIREYASEWLKIHLDSLVEENTWLMGETDL